MARTRRHRRHLSNRAQARRRRLCGKTEDDRRNGNSLVCGGKMTPGGEKATCLRCETCRQYSNTYWRAHQSKKLSSFILSHQE